ncbi:homocysteine S-methyltransferase [Ideonella alba]|uniref:S-methylmethionine:homocysteine methyltransferase n=1 Tax=Ideonella alba TaxID=2824118 RepID=A0A940Y8P6_9BURK|nr:homocysteine S-methyltransferase [Ideonella alba]MBQ0930235.1 homocysteine S-methyltransferase [Ideonella alba]
MIPRPDPIAAWLARRPHLVLDGALATELERRGADLRDALWSARLLIEQPELIRAVHLDYFRAGADVATTASYQASFEGFARRGLSHEDAAALMRLSVRLATEARDQAMAERPADDARPAPLVAASIGPYGAVLADGSEYRGHYGLDEAALIAFHRPRLQLLAASGADLLAGETIPCVAEARALAQLMDEVGARGWISFSARDGGHICEGDMIEDAVDAVQGFDSVVAVGINCTAPQHVAELLARARTRTTKPLLAYPNAGETWDAQAKQWLPSAECAHRPFDEMAMDWAAAGARLIGGCCRTGPAQIAALTRRW